jgi:hypothetical protein
MTDYLATATALGSAIKDLLDGAALTIGGVGFEGFEVPEKMGFGGQQQLTVHKLPGGARVIHAMGPDDRNMEWSGFFRGPQAVSRARQIDAMRIAGKAIDLTWSDFTKKVVIQNFQVDYTKGGFLLPYQISCVVVPAKAPSKAAGLDTTVKADLATSLGIDGLAQKAQDAISLAQKAMPVIGVLTAGSPAFIGLTSAVGTASSVVSGVQSAASSQLASLATAAVSSGGVFGSLSGLSAGADAASSLSTATAAADSLGRVASNLSRVGS